MKRTLFVVLLALLILPACRSPKALVYTSIQNFSMEQGAKPTITLDIRLYNPNHYDIKLKSSDVGVFLNDISMGKIRIEGKHTAPKADTFLLPVTLDMNSQISIPDIVKQVMKGDVKIKLAGTIKGGRHGFYIRVPVDYEGTENLLSNMK